MPSKSGLPGSAEGGRALPAVLQTFIFRHFFLPLKRVGKNFRWNVLVRSIRYLCAEPASPFLSSVTAGEQIPVGE